MTLWFVSKTSMSLTCLHWDHKFRQSHIYAAFKVKKHWTWPVKTTTSSFTNFNQICLYLFTINFKERQNSTLSLLQDNPHRHKVLAKETVKQKMRHQALCDIRNHISVYLPSFKNSNSPLGKGVPTGYTRKKLKETSLLLYSVAWKPTTFHIYLFVCFLKDMFLLWLRCYGSESNPSSTENLFRKLEVSTAICWAVLLNKHCQLYSTRHLWVCEPLCL